MDEYIRRGAAIEQFEDSTSAIPEKLARIRIKEIPAADVVEVRHGRWVDEKYVWQGQKSAQCNQCKKKTGYYIQPKYCPNCGAKMDGGQDDAG